MEFYFLSVNDNELKMKTSTDKNFLVVLFQPKLNKNLERTFIARNSALIIELRRKWERECTLLFEREV
jgi:hypothetical protein